MGLRGKQTDRLGPYRLGELLGRGGMGEVWSAEHVMLGRPAAVKIIRPEALGLDEKRRRHVLERFEREARATSALTSPHTIQIYDFGRTSDGAFYYAMELLEGYTLRTLVDQEGPISAARTAYIMKQICESLAEAHERGLIHRDVKPENVFLCKRGLEYDFVKVLDFGLVKQVSGEDEAAQLTADDMVPGSPAYMPPEALHGKDAYDARSDLYSLGCVAYWLLTGQLVFEHQRALAMVMAHLHEPPPAPSTRSEVTLPRALDELVMRLLSKRPGDRPPTAEALFHEIDACGITPPWTGEAAGRWWRLHRGERVERISFVTPATPMLRAQAPTERPPSRQRKRVLVVDDEPAVGLVLAKLLEQAGLDATRVTSGREALEVLSTEAIDVIITDLRMPSMSGMELLHEVALRVPDLPVIMLTAHGTVQLAVEAMRVGACDFLLKPFDREAVLFSVGKALRGAEHSHDRPPEPRRSSVPPSFEGSAAMARCSDLVRRAAGTTAVVLLRGERGTGKEVLAREIHAQSARAKAAFVKVSCAALPDELLEPELFGYEAGAFPGAATPKPGRIELAEGGTIFLDEVSELGLAAQVKLLRLLQNAEIVRVGARVARPVDVRVVASSSVDLEALVALGALREDLFYRLNVLTIEVPPLRERREDVPSLANELCERHARINGREMMSFDEPALALLAEHAWPGNVRELRNFVERLVVFSERERIDVETVRAELNAGARRSIEGVLERAGGDRTQAARLLGMSRRELHDELHSNADG